MIRWVIGRGLLGRAVERELGGEVFTTDVRWSDEDACIADLRDGLDAFGASDAAEWEIYWCAGAGVTSSGRSVFDREIRVFATFVDSLSRLPGGAAARGALFLASSVGGAYAGNRRPPFSEFSPARPLSPYGEAKLRMESIVRECSEATGMRSFIARITNLYGPGQDLTKGQGLISTIARTYLTGQPASIFVPLDTIRDYLFVTDCARVVVRGTAKLRSSPPAACVLKIVGSASAVSIGALIGEFSRLRRRRPLIVLGAGNASGQAPDLRVRSVVWTDLDDAVSTTLPEGIAATFESLRLGATGATG